MEPTEIVILEAAFVTYDDSSDLRVVYTVTDLITGETTYYVARQYDFFIALAIAESECVAPEYYTRTPNIQANIKRILSQFGVSFAY